MPDTLNLDDLTDDEIIAELQALALTLSTSDERADTIAISHEAWYAMVWLGPWPHLPPPLDLWRIDLAESA